MMDISLKLIVEYKTRERYEKAVNMLECDMFCAPFIDTLICNKSIESRKDKELFSEQGSST